MIQTVEIFYSFQCPYSYLAIDRLSLIEEKFDVQVLWQPFANRIPGKNLQSSQNISPDKVSYIKEDVVRLAQLMEKPLVMRADWPEVEFDPDRSTRGAIIAADMGFVFEYNIKMFDRWWGVAEDPNDQAYFMELAEELDVDSHEFASKMSSTDTRERVRGNYRRAKKLGIFDTPTIVIGEERYVGIDRIQMAEDRLLELGMKKSRNK
jgi:2-hydroxychromene-2-carboxylate isomerase